MNDQQIHNDPSTHHTLGITPISPANGGGLLVDVRNEEHAGRGAFINTARLLAMIDAADPDAMRAYLLETVPEADSPEDVDEHPDRDDPTERAQIDRAWAMERAAEVLGRLLAVTGAEGGEVPVIGYASWILTGSTETLDR